MGARCTTASHLIFGQAHRPPQSQGHNLFIADPSEFNPANSNKVVTPEELVVCPSRHGAHIIKYKDNQCLYKIKTAAVMHGEYARFSLYQCLPNGHASRVAVAQVDKTRTVLAAKKGSYSLVQAWHLAAYKLVQQERTGLHHKRKPKNTPTPTEASAMNMHIKVTGKRDMTRGRGGERWDAEFAISDTFYKMKMEGEGHACQSRIKSVRVYEKDDELVCAAHLQGFEHMRRPGYERPFMGIQLRGKINTTNLSGLGANNTEQAELCKPSELLPLLLCLAWGEEVIHPPDDNRAHYLERMRSDDQFVPKSNDVGWDTILTASSILAAAQADGIDEDGEKSRVGGLNWKLEPPLPPTATMSTHIKNNPSSLKKQHLSDIGSISLTGV